MRKFLIDVNLPYYFGLWHTDKYIHQQDINPTAKDEEIWEYASINNLTIITKDSDFSNRILLNDPPPKVVHLRIGNMSMSKFHNVISSLWDEVLNINNSCKLVTVYQDRIEAIN